MARLRIILAVTALALAGCGYDGHYRYECQDPANWDAEDCNPPICEVDGACTETLLGFDPRDISETTVETVPTEETVAP